MLANPAQHHGKRLAVRGYFRMGFEVCALYLTKEHADHGAGENALWVRFGPNPRPSPSAIGAHPRPQSFDGQYVVLTGTFDMNEFGHLSAFAGGLVDVDLINASRP